MPLVIRIIANVLLFIGAILAPWWLYAGLLIVAIAYFNDFYEGFLWSALADILYGAYGGEIYQVPMLLTLGTFVAFYIGQWVKTRMRYSW
jgi:hypothetical protein